MPTLNWIGKQAVEKHHLEIPYRLLEYDESLSVGDKESGNLLVQGDNLHALKALLPYYAGKVKCIYIDPPYNTGNEGWKYNDNVNSPEIKKWLNEVVGPEGEDLSRHDKWLCMMYPRLQLLKKMLKKNGAIFISIDDNEQANLKLLMDEVFGPNNFVTNIIWEKNYSPRNDARYFSAAHDFIICYAKNKNSWVRNLLPRSEKQNKFYKFDDADGRGPWRPDNILVKTFTESGVFGIINPNSGIEYYPPKGSCYRITKNKAEQLLSENKIYFGKDGLGKPQLKRYLAEVKQGLVPQTIWKYDEVGHNQDGKKELNEMIEGNVFDSPKPVRLLKQIIKLSTHANDTILDSFSGSGTTGQAIVELNNEDGGNRNFILIELEENIAKEVTAERIKRVINGYSAQKQNDTTAQVKGVGGGFRYCNLGEPLFDKFGNVRQGVKFKELARHVFFSENGVPLSEKAKLNTPLIGTYKGAAYYLLFNGIFGDKTVNGGNVLTSRFLESLPKHNGPKIIFGESNRLSAARLKKENIVFKQIPYEIKTS